MNRRNQIIERCNRALPVYYSMLRNLKEMKLPYPLLVRLYRATLRSNSFTRRNRKLLMRREVMMLRGFAKIAHPHPSNKVTLFNLLRGRTINRSLSSGNFAISDMSVLKALSSANRLTTKDTFIQEINAIPFATKQYKMHSTCTTHSTIQLFYIQLETQSFILVNVYMPCDQTPESNAAFQLLNETIRDLQETHPIVQRSFWQGPAAV